MPAEIETTPQRLFAAPEEQAAAKQAQASAKETIRHVLQNLPEHITLSAICRATAGEVLPQSMIQFRATGSGIGEGKLAQLEDALRSVGALPPISPA